MPAIRRAASIVTFVSMVATPLNRRGGGVRRVLTNVVVGGLFTTTVTSAARRWGVSRTALAAGPVVAGTATLESIGTRSGFPFGRYAYTGTLGPTVAGVPVAVPLAWFAMALPARETAVAVLGGRSSRLTRIVTGSLALMAWDLFLDPQMVGEGYWNWAKPGRYRGIPASNFVGWFVGGCAVMAMLDVALPPTLPRTSSPVGHADPELVAIYGAMGLMETAAFGSFFSDRVVAVAGGAAMLPVAAVGGLRLLQRQS